MDFITEMISKLIVFVCLMKIMILLQRYDCGVSQHYEMESHGGTTFCAIAALHLSGQMDILTEATREKLIRWLVFRQVYIVLQSKFCFLFNF